MQLEHLAFHFLDLPHRPLTHILQLPSERSQLLLELPFLQTGLLRRLYLKPGALYLARPQSVLGLLQLGLRYLDLPLRFLQLQQQCLLLRFPFFSLLCMLLP